MTSSFLVKGEPLNNIIETGGSNNQFETHYGDSNIKTYNPGNFNDMKPLNLGYQIGGTDFQNQCKAFTKFHSNPNTSTSNVTINVPKNSKSFRAILVGSSGGKGGNGGDAAIKIEAGSTRKANGGNGGIGGYGNISYTNKFEINNNHYLLQLNPHGNNGNNGNKESKNVNAGSVSTRKGNRGNSGSVGGSTILRSINTLSIDNATGGNGGGGGEGGSVKSNKGSNFNSNGGSDGTSGTDNRTYSNTFDVSNIQNYGDPNSNNVENKNGAALIIWLWD